jgi:hypothetical protein
MTKTADSGGNFSYSGRYGTLNGYGGTGGGAREFQFPSTYLNNAFAATGQASFVALLDSRGTDATGNFSGIVTRNAGFNEHYPENGSNLVAIGPFAGQRWVTATSLVTNMAIPHVYGATHKSGEQKAYQAGALLGSATRVETPAMDGSTCGTGGTGAVYLIAFWNRVLSPDEMFALAQNPWQLLAADPRRFWMPEPVAAAAPLTKSIVRSFARTRAASY